MSPSRERGAGPKALDRVPGLRFKDVALRELTMTHRSYAFEQGLEANNERLEFLALISGGSQFLRLLTTAEGINAADASRFIERVLVVLPEWEPKMNDPALTAEQKAELENTLKAELERIAVEIMGAKGRDVVKKLDQ